MVLSDFLLRQQVSREGVNRKVRPVSNETPKPVRTRPITHPITKAQDATTTQRQLPHVQVDIRQPIGTRLETSVV